jgi:phage terminase large subunit-like protein
MANNASIEVDPAGNIKPVKSTETGRIDGIYALIMALDAAIVREGDMRSIYGEREMRFL